MSTGSPIWRSLGAERRRGGLDWRWLRGTEIGKEGVGER